MKLRYIILGYFAFLALQVAVFYVLSPDGDTLILASIINALILMVVAIIIAKRLRQRYSFTTPVTRHLDERKQLVYSTMAQRGTRPWQIAEISYMTGLPESQVRQVLNLGMQSAYLPQFRPVRRGYMTHPVTGLEVEVWALQHNTLRQYGGVQEKDFPENYYVPPVIPKEKAPSRRSRAKRISRGR